jgi:hypothetical protein
MLGNEREAPVAVRMRRMSSVYSQDDLRKLILLVIEIGDLRLRLSHAHATVLSHNPSGEIDDDGEVLIEGALDSARELGTIIAFLSRRMEASAGFAELAKAPLNQYEQAHLDAARANAEALESYSVRKTN